MVVVMETMGKLTPSFDLNNGRQFALNPGSLLHSNHKEVVTAEKTAVLQ